MTQGYIPRFIAFKFQVQKIEISNEKIFQENVGVFEAIKKTPGISAWILIDFHAMHLRQEPSARLY